jgi:hypothetical protein
VAWTKTSLPPPWGEMKPKPFVTLKNLTVPVIEAIEYSFEMQKLRPGKTPERRD